MGIKMKTEEQDQLMSTLPQSCSEKEKMTKGKPYSIIKAKSQLFIPEQPVLRLMKVSSKFNQH